MSVLQYPDSIKDLQVWDNAAFDNGDSNDSVLPIKGSWCSMQSLSGNEGSESVEVDSSKENQSPGFCISPVCENSPIPIKPLGSKNGNAQGKPLKVLFKQGLLPLPQTVVGEGVCEDSKIDSEIEEIEKEIGRLSMKLETLRLEKLRRESIRIEIPAPVVPEKIVKPQKVYKAFAVPKNIETTPASSKRRGATMGPWEIAAGVRSQQKVKPEITPIQSRKGGRGISLGPAEILAGVTSQQKGKQEIAPIQSTQQDRRKSCFLKLGGINEEKVTKERGGRSLSLSPKSRLSKIQATRQGFTTVGSKKSAKKDDRVISSIQPKKLFKEGEKSVPSKKPAKVGRVIASRYNQIPGPNGGNPTESARRKSSLPGIAGGDFMKSEQKRAISVGKSRIPGRVGISSESVTSRSSENSNPPSALKIADFLPVPKIKTVRCMNETPRDSGPAKKVAELVGKKSYFATEDYVETSVCQALCFDEEEEEY